MSERLLQRQQLCSVSLRCFAQFLLCERFEIGIVLFLDVGVEPFERERIGFRFLLIVSSFGNLVRWLVLFYSVDYFMQGNEYEVACVGMILGSSGWRDDVLRNKDQFSFFP